MKGDRSERVYCHRGVVLLDRGRRKLRLRLLQCGPVRLTADQARELADALYANAGELEEGGGR